jgi:hypothetical protein
MSDNTTGSDALEESMSDSRMQPLWDAKRMGEACKRNAEKRSQIKPKPSFDAIVKFAYEATLTEMRDDYQVLVDTLTRQRQQDAATIATLQAENAALREQLDKEMVDELEIAQGRVVDLEERNNRLFHKAARRLAEIKELQALIQYIDAHAPRADSTCDEPGISLSEAAKRAIKDELRRVDSERSE